ncbi:hypothetical protein B0H16DRAFT_1516481 [Mycena metata]|uniref:Secreted protein n=1 Tax=Mycena metata TaxID=1033252 RepID=A0AAD7NQ49_9AGAR|nr:hypothetical protein B0H16DRAFT_1619976 [Mycena metata]KAJ7769807.1 hypothetical protein B0H16DRAFT_1516481 [Mycena metata]
MYIFILSAVSFRATVCSLRTATEVVGMWSSRKCGRSPCSSGSRWSMYFLIKVSPRLFPTAFCRNFGRSGGYGTDGLAAGQ